MSEQLITPPVHEQEEGHEVPIAQRVLDCRMPESDATGGASTVGELLGTLLSKAGTEGMNFDAKRPYGFSGWRHDVYEALVVGGLLEELPDRTGQPNTEQHIEETADYVAEGNALIAEAVLERLGFDTYLDVSIK